MVRTLYLRLEIAGSIAAAALISVTLDDVFKHISLSPNSIIWYQRKLGSKHAHHATHRPRVHGLAALAGARIRAP